MTREEAIKVLENERACVLNDTCQRAECADCAFVMETKSVISALDLALTALRPVSREQVERVWRGEWEWYDEEIGSPLEGVERDWGWRCSKCKVVLPDDFDDPDNPPAMRFCQWCGAPMTDEAVEVVMERLEAINNA